MFFCYVLLHFCLKLNCLAQLILKPHHTVWEKVTWGSAVALNFDGILPIITFLFLNALYYRHGTDYYVDWEVPDHRILGTFLLSHFSLLSLPNRSIILKAIINLPLI